MAILGHLPALTAIEACIGFLACLKRFLAAVWTCAPVMQPVAVGIEAVFDILAVDWFNTKGLRELFGAFPCSYLKAQQLKVRREGMMP